VLDVGKSNVRLYAIDEDAWVMCAFERPNRVVAGAPYPHFAVDELFEWLLEGLKKLAREFEIRLIVPVTHGACAALVDDHGLALPIMDYEFDGLREFDPEYEPQARDFARSGSPALPAGLNLGRQLFWQQRKFPREFERATIIPCPQYFAWRLSGVRAWEATSLGCHTDLWEASRNRFSPLAQTLGWAVQFGSRADPWTVLGEVTPEIRAKTGITNSCAVLAGIHDSNASYLAHRATRTQPFCVVSTGTWIVIMAHGAPLEALDESRDMLANVDAFGSPLPTARFMGGREYAAICGDHSVSAMPSVKDLHAVVAAGSIAVPSFSRQGGPFRAHQGRIEGRIPDSPRERAALAAFYCALMTTLSMDTLQARGDVIVEGRLASNEAFIAALAALRAPDPVFRSLDESGTAKGAAILAALARGAQPTPARLLRCEPGAVEEVQHARDLWRRHLPETHY
jgi:sugar (pentulose or hexulose) kinase